MKFFYIVDRINFRFAKKRQSNYQSQCLSYNSTISLKNSKLNVYQQGKLMKRLSAIIIITIEATYVLYFVLLENKHRFVNYCFVYHLFCTCVVKRVEPGINRIHIDHWILTKGRSIPYRSYNANYIRINKSLVWIFLV